MSTPIPPKDEKPTTPTTIKTKAIPPVSETTLKSGGNPALRVKDQAEPAPSLSVPMQTQSKEKEQLLTGENEEKEKEEEEKRVGKKLKEQPENDKIDDLFKWVIRAFFNAVNTVGAKPGGGMFSIVGNLLKGFGGGGVALAGAIVKGATGYDKLYEYGKDMMKESGNALIQLPVTIAKGIAHTVIPADVPDQSQSRSKKTEGNLGTVEKESEKMKRQTPPVSGANDLTPVFNEEQKQAAKNKPAENLTPAPTKRDEKKLEDEKKHKPGLGPKRPGE